MTTNSLSDLKKIVKLMNDNQLNYVKVGPIEVTKNEWSMKPQAAAIKKLTPEEQMKIEEEELFWSSK
jgi:hypothetical protein